jgi:hypothetical protein
MARTTNRPSTAIRPDTATARLDTNGSGSFDGPDQRGENGHLGDNAERRENLTALRDEQDNDRTDSLDNRDESRTNRDERGNRNRRDDRGFGDNRDQRTPRYGDTEQGSRREQPQSPSAGLDTFAPVLEAWKQVFKSWSELTETMVKAQQDAFASMIGAANTTAKNINDIKVGDRHNDELAFSGSRSTAARTTASTPDRIEHDRR